MTLTKKDIVETLVQELGHPKKQTFDMVETLLDIIKDDLESGNDLMVSGFGKFCVKEKNGRRGRNPATGDSMTLRARRVVTFKASGKLRLND
ncbi:MAG: integration host factor subunit alpha [Anaerolineaceae bacterium]|nr:integration host factor subunit alpha [Anaerolineaceae bacterium]